MGNDFFCDLCYNANRMNDCVTVVKRCGLQLVRVSWQKKTHDGFCRCVFFYMMSCCASQDQNNALGWDGR